MIPPDLGAASRLIYIHADARLAKTCVTAVGAIERGAVLMVEHVFGGTKPQAAVAVLTDRSLFNLLHPRAADSQHDTRPSSVVDGLLQARQKLELNQFAADTDDDDSSSSSSSCPTLIGSACTRFNHCCNANAMFASTCVEGRWYMWFVSTRRVGAGEEITICYDVDAGHADAPLPLLAAIRAMVGKPSDYGFECACGMTEQQRMSRLHSNVTTHLRTELAAMPHFQQIVRQYSAKTDKVGEVDRRHMAIRLLTSMMV